ncbi:MAG: hypothetical protein H0W06_01900 [Chloroflexia bacterium]|nr:hypothetical protein [Chloroflexia bacterium]
MRPRPRAPWQGWALWATAILLDAAALTMIALTRSEARVYEYWLEPSVNAPVYATVGLLILRHRPGHLIGRLFVAISLVGSFQVLTGQYATVAASAPVASLPAAAISAWLSELAQLSLVVGLLFTLMLFPTGSLPSARWRPLVPITGCAVGLGLVTLALRRGHLENFPSFENPVGVIPASVADTLNVFSALLALGCFAAAVISLIYRFRRSEDEERLQLKWFVWAAILGFALLLFGNVLVSPANEERFGSLIWTVAPLALPLSAGVAILRYRLYDIDRVISRTLAYGALTALLASIYLLAVLALQSLLPLDEDSPLIVAASTLGVVAAFGPLRNRVQNVVDRRFNRSRYDARRTIDAFGATLRQQTELDQLSRDLVALVHATIQPAHASLWLLPQPGARR